MTNDRAAATQIAKLAANHLEGRPIYVVARIAVLTVEHMASSVGANFDEVLEAIMTNGNATKRFNEYMAIAAREIPAA